VRDDEDDLREDYVPVTPEARLKEWAIERQHKARSYLPQETPIYRVMREGAGASQGSGGGDGGMVNRMFYAGRILAMENRAREVEEAYREMPGAYRAVVDALYVHMDHVHSDDIVRTLKAAAVLCGLKEHELRSLRERMHGWLVARLTLPVNDDRVDLDRARARA
jgi:hypothetical protein